MQSGFGTPWAALEQTLGFCCGLAGTDPGGPEGQLSPKLGQLNVGAQAPPGPGGEIQVRATPGAAVV